MSDDRKKRRSSLFTRPPGNVYVLDEISEENQRRLALALRGEPTETSDQRREDDSGQLLPVLDLERLFDETKGGYGV